MVGAVAFAVGISIHAPRGGSDAFSWSGDTVIILFQSTLPVGGATSGAFRYYCRRSISIHAPRGGSDQFQHHKLEPWRDISIHAPRGGSDRGKEYTTYEATQFQSTLPVGGATHLHVLVQILIQISIHAPRGGSDLDFEGEPLPEPEISIHAPRGGSDLASD